MHVSGTAHVSPCLQLSHWSGAANVPSWSHVDGPEVALSDSEKHLKLLSLWVLWPVHPHEGSVCWRTGDLIESPSRRRFIWKKNYKPTSLDNRNLVE